MSIVFVRKGRLKFLVLEVFLVIRVRMFCFVLEVFFMMVFIFIMCRVWLGFFFVCFLFCGYLFFIMYR